MIATAFRNLHWGFLFMMIDFRIGGFDVLPDIIGYILFAAGLGALAEQNGWFARAKGYIWPVIILSVFQLYEKPAGGSGVYVNWGFGVILGLAMAIISLLTVYSMFMGIRDMASRAGNVLIADEVLSKWSQYLNLAIAGLLSFIVVFIPFIGILYILGLLLFNLILAMSIMGLMRRCEAELREAQS